MRGSSRAALATMEDAFGSALTPGADLGRLAEDLFAVVGVIDGNATLRRALTDPSREPATKRGLVTSLFGGKIGASAVSLVAAAAGQRWAAERDFGDTLEGLAVQSVLAQAERAGHIDEVEDQLFRFERIVAGDAGLRDTLSSRNTDTSGKAGLVHTLLDGRAFPETIRLAVQAVSVPRGRRLDRILEEYLRLATRRRDELAALVQVARPLTDQQTARLQTRLESIYGKSVKLQVVIDPEVLGGIRVQVGDDVVDGTVSRRLDEARRHVTGG